MMKNKFKIHSIIPFQINGVVDSKGMAIDGAKENAQILYQVLTKTVSAMTFLEFIKLFEEKFNRKKSLNPSFR